MVKYCVCRGCTDTNVSGHRVFCFHERKRSSHDRPALCAWVPFVLTSQREEAVTVKKKKWRPFQTEGQSSSPCMCMITSLLKTSVSLHVSLSAVGCLSLERPLPASTSQFSLHDFYIKKRYKNDPSSHCSVYCYENLASALFSSHTEGLTRTVLFETDRDQTAEV